MLTDPCINCMKPKYGKTNFGEAGIELFFRNHSCGMVCKAMNLKRNKYMVESIVERVSKAMTQLTDDVIASIPCLMVIPEEEDFTHWIS